MPAFRNRIKRKITSGLKKVTNEARTVIIKPKQIFGGGIRPLGGAAPRMLLCGRPMMMKCCAVNNNVNFMCAAPMETKKF